MDHKLILISLSNIVSLDFRFPGLSKQALGQTNFFSRSTEFSQVSSPFNLIPLDGSSNKNFTFDLLIIHFIALHQTFSISIRLRFHWLIQYKGVRLISKTCQVKCFEHQTRANSDPLKGFDLANHKPMIGKVGQRRCYLEGDPSQAWPVVIVGTPRECNLRVGMVTDKIFICVT